MRALHKALHCAYAISTQDLHSTFKAHYGALYRLPLTNQGAAMHVWDVPPEALGRIPPPLLEPPLT